MVDVIAPTDPVPETRITTSSLPSTSNTPRFAETPIVPSTTDQSPWTILTILPPSGDMPHIRSDVVKKVLVKLERSAIGKWQSGDIVELPIPQTGQTVSVKIDTVTVLPSGNKSIIGHRNGAEGNDFIMTIGTGSIFATIGTDDGIFNLSGNEDYAWVVSSRQLKRNLDPDIPDFRVLEPAKE